MNATYIERGTMYEKHVVCSVWEDEVIIPPLYERETQRVQVRLNNADERQPILRTGLDNNTDINPHQLASCAFQETPIRAPSS